MQGKSIAILENRVGEQLADLVRKRGATPVAAPALAEVPDVDPEALRALLARWHSRPPDVFVFQTGVGARALFAAVDRLGLAATLDPVLDAATTVVRGPKPTAALRARNVRIDLAAGDPFTTREVLAELDGAVDLRGKRVAVQRYGETNVELTQALEERGATVEEIVTYRWSLPDDVQPLLALVDALEAGRIDAVAFTSASQAGNLFEVARGAGRLQALKDGLASTTVASIGPVCTAALVRLGVHVDLEAKPPKLGPFVTLLDQALSAPRGAA